MVWQLMRNGKESLWLLYVMVSANILQSEMLIQSFTSSQKMKNQSVKKSLNLQFNWWKQATAFERSISSSNKVTYLTKVSMIRSPEKSSISISNLSSSKHSSNTRSKTTRVEKQFDLTIHLIGRKRLSYSKVKQVLKDLDLKIDWSELML